MENLLNQKRLAQDNIDRGTKKHSALTKRLKEIQVAVDLGFNDNELKEVKTFIYNDLQRISDLVLESFDDLENINLAIREKNK